MNHNVQNIKSDTLQTFYPVFTQSANGVVTSAKVKAQLGEVEKV